MPLNIIPETIHLRMLVDSERPRYEGGNVTVLVHPEGIPSVEAIFETSYYPFSLFVTEDDSFIIDHPL